MATWRWYAHSDGTCCCDAGPCRSFSDGFNRADGTDIGSTWTEVSGDWSISSNTLAEAGTSGAVAIYNNHWSQTAVIANVNTVSESNGDRYRIVVNYKDSANYMYAELYINGVNGSEISLHSVSGGADTTLETDTILSLTGTSRTFAVCLGSNGFQGSVNNAVASLVWNEQGPVHADGYQSGLGNGAAQAIEFDDFYMSEHLDDNADCPGCICACDGKTWPKVLNAKVTYSGRCAPVVNTFTITYDRIQGEWIGTYTCVDEMTLRVQCNADIDLIDISLEPYGTCCDLSTCSGPPETGSTCNPLYFVRTISYAGLGCNCCPPSTLPPPPVTVVIEVWE